MNNIVVGTRGSKLALVQTKNFIARLKEHYPDFNFTIKKIKTSGDRILDKSLKEVGGKGLFIKEIEYALKTGEIDIAVHSLKDLPAKIKDDFMLACYPGRENPHDVLISKQGLLLNQLPEGARLGTGSSRRRVQLKRYRKDFDFENIRGNVDTRLEKMEAMELEGIILAAAGLHRLGHHQLITQYIPGEVSIPAAGQGTLGIEILRERKDLLTILNKIDNKFVRLVSLAERKFLAVLGANCHSPVGAYADSKVKAGTLTLTLTAFLSSINSQKIIMKKDKIRIEQEEKAWTKARNLGEKVAISILDSGGNVILKRLKEDE